MRDLMLTILEELTTLAEALTPVVPDEPETNEVETETRRKKK